jgi:hypothetical protein
MLHPTLGLRATAIALQLFVDPEVEYKFSWLVYGDYVIGS